MANQPKRQQMRRDCARLMAWPIVAAFFQCLLSIAVPTLLALLLGDMADALLALDTPAIFRQLPAFALAIAIQVLLVPGVTLWKNLLLTKQGTAYDFFLMESTLGLTPKNLHAIDAGEYIHRFTWDRTDYYFTIVELCAYPLALLVYGGLLGFFLWKGGYPPLFCLLILGLPGLSVVYDGAVAKKKAAWRQQEAKYESARTEQTLEAFALRDFSRGFGLNGFFLSRLHGLFEAYWKETGKDHSSKNALSATIQFLWDYGLPTLVILAGALLIAQGQMEAGALLGGYLLLPTVKKSWEYGKQILLDIPMETSCGQRMAYFYQDQEDPGVEKEAAAQLNLEGISFSYESGGHDILRDFSLGLDSGSNIHLTGPNGCGKSTLLSILAGVQIPDNGRITDGQGRAVNLAQLWKTVALQEQDGGIFTGTVWENLFLPESRRNEGESLLRAFGFEKSLDEALREGGKNLSPGERKKLLLARALLKDAPFLALDEPLNHLDAASCALLSRKLRSRNGGLILVSHQDLPNLTIPKVPM